MVTIMVRTYFIINLGHVNVNHVAKLVLCIVGDTYIAKVAFDFYKLV